MLNIFHILKKSVFNHYYELIYAYISVHIYHHMSLFILMKLVLHYELIIISLAFSKELTIPFIVFQDLFTYQINLSKFRFHYSFRITFYPLSQKILIFKMNLHLNWNLLINLQLILHYIRSFSISYIDEHVGIRNIWRTLFI